MTKAEFDDAVNTYCTIMEASVTGGRRTTKRNAQKGGKHNSAHLDGLGADVVCDEPRTISAHEETAEMCGLLAIVEKDHIHLQPLDWRPR